MQVFLGKPIASDALVTKLNQIRTSNGLSSFQENPQLYLSSGNKACDMSNKNYWSHTDLEKHKFDWWILQAGYSYYTAGENLARNFSNDTLLINAWMKSPSHRDNILSTNYNEVGVGRCGNYVVLHFGSK